MRGKNYNDGSRKLIGRGSLGVILLVLAIATALVLVLLLYLPLTDETNKAGVMGKGEEQEWDRIVSIVYPEKEIGVGSEKDKIYLTVTYDSGRTEDVALSQMICSGLDVTVSGKQNVSLSYGGFEQVIPITVKDVDCVLSYTASDGGRIQGESRQAIVSGQDGSTVVAIPETGYTFVEWNDGYPYATRKDKKVNETREYKAIFEKTQFVVFFFYDDGTVAREDTVLYGEAATDIPKMSDPRMSVYGKTFQGWSVSEEDFKNVVRNMNVYPQYIKTATDVNVTVESDQYGSHMGTTNVNEFGYYEHNSTASITATPYNSREFDCWKVWGYTSPSSSTPEWIEIPKKSETGEATVIVYIGDNREVCPFTSNSTGNAGTEYTLTFVPNAYMDMIDIRANFVYNNSTVTFINYQNSIKNNQECVIADIPYGTTIGEALAEKVTTEDGAGLVLDANGMLQPASVYGYTFLGWYDKLDEEQRIITVNKIFREPTSLIAKWEKLVYTVVFDYSTATNSDISYEINVVFQNTVGSGGGVPTIQPYRDKYNFVGWEDVLTHDLVDDTTQITVKEEYLTANKNFIDERKVIFAPRWEAKEHVLRVQSTGSGTVYLRTHPLVGAAEESIVSGEQIIYETYTYELVFRADVGHYVSSYVWRFENDVPISQTNVSEAVSPIPKSDGDNYFVVTFSPIVYHVTINNGDSVYRGYVEGIAGSDADSVTFDIHYGDTLALSVVSPNEEYEISDIRVTGRVGGVDYRDESVETGLHGSHTLQYNLLLENCTSDLVITISYDSVSYAVSIKSPENASIGITVFNGTESDYSAAPSEATYAPNERVFYVIEAAEGYYISDVRLNGVHYDLFGSVGDSVVFYDWEVNKTSYGVGMRLIDGVYYYSYGIAQYDSDSYMYCRNVANGEEKIFVVLDALNERYEALGTSDGARNAAVPIEYYEKVSAYLIDTLNVNQKGVGNSSVEKDKRITKVKMMLMPSSNVNLSVTTELVYYSFNVKEDAVASCSVSATEVLPGGKVTVKTKPITGYTVVGYYLNGAQAMTPIYLSSPELTYVKEFDDIRSDISIVFAYELITYSATFTSLANDGATVREEGETTEYRLAKAHTFEGLTFGSKVAYVIRAAEGKRISSLTVNGTDYPVVYNMTSYPFVWQSVRGPLTVTVGCDDLIVDSPAAGGYELTCNLSENSRVSTSVRYEDDGVYLTVLAEEGYYLHSITIHGKKTENGEEKALTMTLGTNSVELSDATGSGVSSADFSYLSNTEQSYQKAVTVRLPSVLFYQTAQAEVNSKPTVYSVSITPPENGTVSTTASEAAYNEKVVISVSASLYYYIDSFEVNGVVVPFASSGWDNTYFDPNVRKYTKGEYSLIVTGNTTIKAVFKRFAYTVKLDEDSINGTTSLHVDGMTEDGKAPHGSLLTISMTANRGYHIKAVYVNGLDVGYDSSSYGENENNVNYAVFEYNGPDGRGISQNVSVRVFYEVNRYSFYYNIVNDSANFSGAAGAGTLTADYTPAGENKYTGIAYGDNFSINVTPATSAGYYLYSVAITYKGYSDTEFTTKTRYYSDGDGIVSKTGNTIWFNRFWFADSSALATGVTADVTDITVTFKREAYSLSLRQNTIGGGMTASFVNPSVNAGRYVVVFGRKSGTNDELTEYYYEASTESSTGRFLRKVGSTYIDSGIVLSYRSGEMGDVVFNDGVNEYEMYFEYGLRSVITVRPDAGYDRTEFTLNGEDRSDYVGSDQYNFNFYRSTVVTVSYLVQEFDIGIKAVIYTDRNNNQKITAASGKSNDYINMVLSVLDENGNVLRTYSKEPLSLELSKTLPYGTIVRYDIQSKFAAKGVYLYNLTRTTIGADGNPVVTEIRPIDGDVEGLVSFGPFAVTEELTLNAYFEIRSYNVSTSISYDEALNNEGRNTVSKDGDASKSSWSVFWGSDTAVNVSIDDGFDLDEIIVTLGGRTIVLSAVNPGRDTDAAYYVENEEDPLYGVRNVLHLVSVKSDVNVQVALRRRAYTSVFSVNNTQTIDSLTVYFNEYSNIYPRSEKTPDSAWQMRVRHYDELRAVVAPKDGYEIVAQQVGIYRAVRNEATGEWDKESSTPLIMLDFTVVTGDTKQFTFHPSDGYALIAINGDIIVEISVTIKRYKLESTVVRTDASNDTSPNKNDTAVSLNVYVSPNDYSFLNVNGSAQQTQILNKNVGLNQSVAQHGSLILYEFITPDGYRMESFTMNGLTLDDMRGYATLTAGKYPSDPTRYQYRISVTVCTALINGAPGFFKSSPDLISVKMVLSPIVYDVVIVINQSVREFGTYNERSGASDDQTLTVYAAKSVVHFASVNIDPSLFEGYKINTTDAYIGTSNSTAALDKASFGVDQETLTVRKRFTFNSVNLDKADVTQSKTTVYFFFTTSIIYYRFKLDSMVYYSDAGKILTEPLKTYNDHNATDAGSVECTVSNLIVQSAGGYYTDGAVNYSFPYFSTVTLEAAAGSEFALFAIYENVNGTWQTIRDNVNGLSYTTRKEGSLTRHFLTLTINSIGDRTFRIDFKQRTAITVNVPNPYKYVAGASNTYMYYSEITAFESDVETETGEYVDPSSTSEGIVKTQYVFTVYVGNYFSIRFVDKYRTTSTVNFSVYTTDLSQIAEQCIDNAYVNDVFNTDRFNSMYATMSSAYAVESAKYGGSPKENKRYHILGGETFFVYDNDVYGHVAAEKVTVDATNASGKGGSIGGRIYYNLNSSESRDNVIYEDTVYGTTKEGHVLTVVCEAEPNYAFYRMSFRQMDVTASKNAGYIKFGNTDLNSWQEITYSDANDKRSSALDSFNVNNTNGYVLLNFRKSGNKYYFTLWMNGDVEMKAEFYRTYKVSYAVYLPDEIALGRTPSSAGITAEDVSDIVFTVGGVGPFASSSEPYVSYGSEFRMTVAPQASNYVFVGWYVNDVDLFTSLDKLVPGSDYYMQRFIVDYDNMEALLRDGDEVTELVIYARFEPMIDVQLINEKYYAYDYHFNSWDMGSLQSVYYNYSRDQQSTTGISLSSHAEVTQDTEGMTIASGLQYVEGTPAYAYDEYKDLSARPADWSSRYASYYIKNADGSYVRNTSATWNSSVTYASLVHGKWSNLYSDEVIAGYTSDEKNFYKVFTASHAFTVLLENVVDGDFINNTWTISNIELYMTGMDSDVGFSSWQYYNWKTGVWSTIPYEYVDTSFGVSADGSLYYVDAYTPEYIFSLAALYNGSMPYAVSAVNENNLGGDRPLLVRPDLYKFFNVNLLQFSFSNNYTRLEDVDDRVLSSNNVSPSISDYTDSNPAYGDRNYTSDDRTFGTYEYGSKIELIYNTAAPGSEIYNSARTVRYRFIGWYVKLGEDGTVYCLENSDDTSSSAFAYQLICEPTYSDTSLMLMSYYVAQYKQEFYSYGISGSSTYTYDANAGLRSGKAAPQGYVVAQTATAITIPYAKMQNGAVVYDEQGVDSGTRKDYPRVSNTTEVNGECQILSTDGVVFTKENNAMWSFEYFMDAGLEYTLYVNKNTPLVTTEKIKDFNNKYTDPDYNYFNPEFDTLYKLYVDSAINATQDFSSYYNTGKGTYVIDNAGTQVTPSYLTSRALNENGWENGHRAFTSNTTHTVNVQYVSTATLIFYNLMYGSGVSIANSGFVRALTGGNKPALTVWDDSKEYGDWVDNGGTSPVFFNKNNGEVVIRVTLMRMDGNGYAGSVLYNLKGMKEGNGIPSQNWVYDMSKTHGLFSPTNLGYGRWLEYDLDDYYGGSIISNTRVFGGGGFLSNDVVKGSGAPRHETRKIGNHPATSDYYNEDYCGLGTEDAPYNVYIQLLDGTHRYTDNSQLQFVSTFWKYNDYSCRDDNDLAVYFRMYTDNIRDSGNNVIVSGIGDGGVINLQHISVRQEARGNPQGSSAYIWEPICGSEIPDEENIVGFDGVFDFKGCAAYALAVGDDGNPSGQYYGLFGKVCGGMVQNLTFINGYYNNFGSVKYLGLVCGYAEDASFKNINFEMNNDKYNAYNGASFNASAGNAQIFLSGPDYVGALFGYGKQCDVYEVVINSNNVSNLYAEVSGAQYGGLLIGAIEGGKITNVTVHNNIWIASDSNPFNDATGASGGLIGYAGGIVSRSGVKMVCEESGKLDINGIYMIGKDAANTPTLIIGKESSSVSGGIFGVVGYGATVNDVDLRTSTGSIVFRVDEEQDHVATRNAIILRASTYSRTDDTLKLLGSAGFVGAIAGINYGTINGSACSVDSNVFAYSGVAGGLVGANFGTVEYFTLGSTLRLYAWETTESGPLRSFNYGGLVGYNYAGAGAKILLATEEFTADTDGLIDHCTLRGAYQTSNAYTGETGWNTASVYTFNRKSINDNDYATGKFFITTGSAIDAPGAEGTEQREKYNRVSNRENYVDKQDYLRMGGICGYSTGRIYNCLVESVRLSTYKWRYSYASSPALGGYSWAVQAGLICGYFDPIDGDIKGWEDYMTDTGEFNPTNASYNNNRIQSCVANTCSINVNGNIWMDNIWDANGPNHDGCDDSSLAAGVSVAGIVGGVSMNASNKHFAVNNCKATNIQHLVYFQAYGLASSGGGASKDYGWRTYDTSYKQGWGPWETTVTNFHAASLRSFAIIEANVAGIASGLVTPVNGKKDSGYAEYCYQSGITRSYTPQSEVIDTYKDLGESTEWFFGWGASEAGDISGAWLRYVKYSGGGEKGGFDYDPAGNIINDEIVPSMSGSIYEVTSSAAYNFGFKNGKVVATDPKTGCLYCTYNDINYAYRYMSGGDVKWIVSDNPPAGSIAIPTIG